MAANHFVRFAPVLRASTQRARMPSIGRSIAPAVRSMYASSIMRAAVVDKDPQLGRYPQFPPRSTQLRKHDERYFDKQEKKNFGETLHEQDDFLGVWAPDVHANVNPYMALRQLLLALSTFAAVGGVVYVTMPDPPALRRTYPRDGLANELGGPQAAALAEGAFDKKDDEEEEEEDD